MEIIRIRLKDIYRIRRLYMSAFPKNERKPFALMFLNSMRKKLDIFCIEEGGGFAGLAVTAEYEDKALLIYFAIEKSMRRRGVGSEALRLIMRKYEDKIFYLEIESTRVKCPDLENRLRRKGFYKKNGLTESGLDVSLFGIEMEVLTRGEALGYEEYIKPYEHNFGKWIRKKITKL